jgi:hypothetical protein
MPTQMFLTGKLSVIDLSAIQGMAEGIEFLWRGSDMWFGRLPVWEDTKAMEIATRIEAEASTEEEAIAIFEEMTAHLRDGEEDEEDEKDEGPSVYILVRSIDNDCEYGVFTRRAAAEAVGREWLYKCLVKKAFVYPAIAYAIAYEGDYTHQDGSTNAYQFYIEERILRD